MKWLLMGSVWPSVIGDDFVPRSWVIVWVDGTWWSWWSTPVRMVISHKPSYNTTIWPYYTLLTLLITSYQSLGLHSLSRHSSRLEHDQRRTGTYVDPQAELPNSNKERGYIYDFKRYHEISTFNHFHISIIVFSYDVSMFDVHSYAHGQNMICM